MPWNGWPSIRNGGCRAGGASKTCRGKTRHEPAAPLARACRTRRSEIASHVNRSGPAQSWISFGGTGGGSAKPANQYGGRDEGNETISFVDRSTRARPRRERGQCE